MSTLMLQRLEAAYTGNLKVNFPNQIVLLPEAEQAHVVSQKSRHPIMVCDSVQCIGMYPL